MNTPAPRKLSPTDLALLNQIIVTLGSLEEATEIGRFPQSPEVEEYLSAMRNAGDRLIGLNAELMSLVEGIQKTCEHSWQDFTQWDGKYTWTDVHGDSLLTHRICTKCMKVVSRPDGTPFQVCHKCWAPMKPETPQHGSCFHYSKCSNPVCEHRIMHT